MLGGSYVETILNDDGIAAANGVKEDSWTSDHTITSRSRRVSPALGVSYDCWTTVVADGGLAFRMTGQARNLALVPLNRLFGQRFAVYWRVKPA